jgi:hypothetical protein
LHKKIDSVIRRAAGRINRASSEGDIVFTGGVAKNPCMAAFLAEKLGRQVRISDNPQFIGALGAVLLAVDMKDAFAMELLFVGSKVESRIAALEKTGKSGKNLAQKATGIIDSLASGDVRHHMDAIESYTKYGENRIKNCRKYDLGCGYRLIALYRGKTVFIPFLGSHDECQRWLENNSRLRVFHGGKGKTIHIEDRTPSIKPKDRDNMDMNEDADDFLQNLTDKDLRIMFKGLVEAGSKRLR